MWIPSARLTLDRCRSRAKGARMSELIAIGYPDETAAEEAAREVERLAADLIIEPEQVAVIRRDANGKYHVTTTQHEVGTGAMFGLFWGLLLGVLFLVPVVGVAIGAGVGALVGMVTKLGISEEFRRQVK